MPYVQRDGTGAVTGLYALPQPGYATEWLAEDAAAVQAYRNMTVVPETLTRWQFFAAAAGAGIITQEAAQGALTGTVPQPFAEFIASLPSDQQFTATMLLVGTQEFHRHHPFVAAFLAYRSMTDAQADQIWLAGAALG